MWNDTDVPLAHLITFRCYGTWLHGDSRGAVDRFHNQYKSPYLLANDNWLRYNTRVLKHEPVKLDATQRRSVERAVKETCEWKHWLLRALSVRTNHVHTVVSIGEITSKRALSSLKANATRQMRQDNCWQMQHSPWVSQGSTRNLWNERSIERAVEYVLYGQGDELPDFD
jgi:REP element-mobilizing transposase RayT